MKFYLLIAIFMVSPYLASDTNNVDSQEIPVAVTKNCEPVVVDRYWHSNKSYETGSKVFYSYQDKYGYFINIWWNENEKPSFNYDPTNPWKIERRTDYAGKVLSIRDSVNQWSYTSIYLQGMFVKGSNGLCYEALYWTRGQDPILVETAENLWDIAWTISSKCYDDSKAIFEITEKNIITEIKKPEQQKQIMNYNINLAKINHYLPKEGYKFLHQVTQEHWGWMFPLRFGLYNPLGAEHNKPPIAIEDGSNDRLNLNTFTRAVQIYNAYAQQNNTPQFLNSGTKQQQAQEFIAFLANVSRETSGSSINAKDPWVVVDSISGKDVTVWKGGLYWLEEQGHVTDNKGVSPISSYVDCSSEFVAVKGRSYHGRGIMQLSWNYNYGQFSAWLYSNGITFDGLINSKDTLLKRPDYVVINEYLSMLSAIWFWMTPQATKPSAHDVMLGKVFNVSSKASQTGLPPRNDKELVPWAKGATNSAKVFSYRFGVVTNIINGVLECNKAAEFHLGPSQRASYYNIFAKYFNNEIKGLDVMTILTIPLEGIWDKTVTVGVSEYIKNATCYNQKYYSSW